MKTAILMAAALLAAPALAQTTPADGTTTLSAPTADSTAATPQPQVQSGTAPTSADPSATMPMQTGAAPGSPAASGMAPTPDANAAPMAGGKLPICRAGQYTGCRERENRKGQGLRKR